MTDTYQPTGWLRAHGRTWPSYQREAFSVEVSGAVDKDSVESAEALASELRAVLDKHGLTVRVYSVTVDFLLPEDQAERTALDQLAIDEYNREH